MKCSFCGATFKPEDPDPDQKVCRGCELAADELSNGKGDDEDE